MVASPPYEYSSDDTGTDDQPMRVYDRQETLPTNNTSQLVCTIIILSFHVILAHTIDTQDAEKEKAYLTRFRKELEEERQFFLDKLKFETESNKWSNLENVFVFLSNMPLTIGAVGLGWVTQGVVWFKFMEENTDSCVTTRFNAPECTYPEFPGCFECDTTNRIYQVVVLFHYFCHLVGFLCCILFLLKAVLAWQVVVDELSNPATSTPMGVVCITMVCVAAGRGVIGELVVEATSLFHCVLSFWFLYTAIFKFRLLPDPGWFPNTVGISYAAIKTWLYFVVPGKILMGLAMAFFFSTYFISIYRVIMNHKIAAPVCFIQLSAPSITMYAMTIMAQPSREREMEIEDSPALMNHFNTVHRDLYVPVQHCMMILSLIGMVSVLHSLYARWPKFRHKEFSPAHMAFVFPLLSHTNAVQAYRAGVDSFSNIPVGSPFKIALFTYWFVCLIVGTAVNLIFTAKYVRRLPKWTKVEVGDNESIPVAPSDTIMHEMLEESGVHETMQQPLVNAAVLQANEAGSLVRVARGTPDWRAHGSDFVRTRKTPALGFDLVMSEAELRQEQAELLDWVAKNAPKRRKRTVSIPQMMKLFEGRAVYGSMESTVEANTMTGKGHQRSSTIV